MDDDMRAIEARCKALQQKLDDEKAALRALVCEGDQLVLRVQLKALRKEMDAAGPVVAEFLLHKALHLQMQAAHCTRT